MRVPALLLVLGLAAPLCAQQDPPTDPGALRGPQVPERAARHSLVERDFAGKIKRLDASPEESALELLDLDEAAQAKADAILAARNQILDKIVIDNIDLVVRFANARQAGDRPGQLTLLEEFSKKLQPLNARGKLADELRAILPRDKSARLDALVSDYRRAVSEEEVADAKAKGERLTRLQANLRLNLQITGQEIRRAYERTIAAKGAEFEQILGQLSLRPEQETKVRNLVTDFVQNTKGKPTPEQRRALFFRIMALLDGDQQKALMNAYLGRPNPGL